MRRSTPPSERFHDKYTVNPITACWDWRGSKNARGYGKIAAQGKAKAPLYAHRVSYEMHHGPIPQGIVIDHTCRNTSCVNPDHLEAVTQAENIMRGSAPSIIAHHLNRCHLGHDLNDAYIAPSTGRRHCRECIRELSRRKRR